MTSAVATAVNPFQNSTKSKSTTTTHFYLAISVVDSFHPSAQQKMPTFLNVELDVERKL